jgi:hypothetical protein
VTVLTSDIPPCDVSDFGGIGFWRSDRLPRPDEKNLIF